MIAHGLSNSVQLGDLKVQRDWGYAGDYVEAMWRMLQIAEPADFVLGTGHLHTIEEFTRIAFAAAGLTSRRYVQSVPSLLRGTEPTPIVADIRKARELLGWEPTVDFAQLVTMMVNHDLKVYRQQVGRLRVA
jgi:GDPmannose 4,6-dehydratase